MKAQSITTVLKFNVFVLFPFALILLFLAFFYGCQRAEEPGKEAVRLVTTENLQTAYAKSVRHQRMYARFVEQAEKEKNTGVANLFRAAAKSEEIHAANHARLLQSGGVTAVVPPDDPVTVGTTIQTLKMAVSSEEIETESMYPNLLHTAELEKLPEAVDQFAKTRDADARQLELFRLALDHNGKADKAPYFVCPGCGYILTSASTDECPTCHSAKSSFLKI